MKEYVVDLHVHIGSSLQGHPIKITASPRLTLSSILKGGMERKGLHVVGIVDASSPFVLDDLEYLLSTGDLVELEEGGLLTLDDRLLILGSEVEVKEGRGIAHFLSFFPYLENIKAFSNELSLSMKNINLSSQRSSLKVEELYSLSIGHGGIFLPAHAFTPFKSVYGSCCSSLREILPSFSQKIHQLELGLSADTFLASHLLELKGMTFLSNSDAHSLEKMGREFNLIKMESLSFKNLQEALLGEKGMGVIANYGLDPKLGKYHRTYCQECLSSFPQYQPPLIACPLEGDHVVVMGVLDRVLQLGGEGDPPLGERPPYKYQVPLEFIPGLGEKGIQKLHQAFGSEGVILHSIDYKDLKKVVGKAVATKILMARRGELQFKSGGGGIYGQVLDG